MDEQKLTDWFPPEVLPARPGWYQREYSAHTDLSALLDRIPDYFDGKHWYYGDGGDGRASIPVPTPTIMRWRGLTEPPLTDWFDPDTPPEREGVYEIEEDDGFRHFAYWSKRRGWGHSFNSRMGDAVAIANAVSSKNYGVFWASSRRWRGLAVQP